jgi:hypothetical protein
MSPFRFRDVDGRDIAPQEWLRLWAARYPSKKYDPEHDDLITKCGSFSASDFERIGRWKDDCLKPNHGSWKTGTPRAYDVWMQAKAESPKCPEEDGVADFLQDWSERTFAAGRKKKTGEAVRKRFGLSRSTTLLYFISGQRLPIFDSRVRRAMKRLLNSPVPNSIRWYLGSYCSYFSEIAHRCDAKHVRAVDKALFSFGARGHKRLD